MALQILCKDFLNDLTKIEVYNRYFLQSYSELRLSSLAQDHFGAGRVGPSREVSLGPGRLRPLLCSSHPQLFRSQQDIAQDQDAARFFSATSSVHHFAPESAYDLSAMHAALPVNQTPQMHSNPLASWATNFVQQQPLHALPSQELAVIPKSAMDNQVNAPSQYTSSGISSSAIRGNYVDRINR